MNRPMENDAEHQLDKFCSQLVDVNAIKQKPIKTKKRSKAKYQEPPVSKKMKQDNTMGTGEGKHAMHPALEDIHNLCGIKMSSNVIPFEESKFVSKSFEIKTDRTDIISRVFKPFDNTNDVTANVSLQPSGGMQMYIPLWDTSVIVMIVLDQKIFNVKYHAEVNIQACILYNKFCEDVKDHMKFRPNTFCFSDDSDNSRIQTTCAVNGGLNTTYTLCLDGAPEEVSTDEWQYPVYINMCSDQFKRRLEFMSTDSFSIHIESPSGEMVFTDEQGRECKIKIDAVVYNIIKKHPSIRDCKMSFAKKLCTPILRGANKICKKVVIGFCESNPLFVRYEIDPENGSYCDMYVAAKVDVDSL